MSKNLLFVLIGYKSTTILRINQIYTKKITGNKSVIGSVTSPNPSCRRGTCNTLLQKESIWNLIPLLQEKPNPSYRRKLIPLLQEKPNPSYRRNLIPLLQEKPNPPPTGET